MILVPLLNPKLATVLAAKSCELRVRGTSRRSPAYSSCPGRRDLKTEANQRSTSLVGTFLAAGTVGASAGLTTQTRSARQLPSCPGRVPVPRTRSSHDFAAGTSANFGFKKRHWNHRFASVLCDSEVRTAGAANACELRNRDTRAKSRKIVVGTGLECA